MSPIINGIGVGVGFDGEAGVGGGGIPPLPPVGKPDKGRFNAGGNVTKVAGKVSKWDDASGEGNDLFQLTESKKPIWSETDSDFNDNSVIAFDGIDDFLQTNTFTGGTMPQPNTIFFVARWDDFAPSTWNYAFDGIASGESHLFYIENTNKWVMATFSEIKTAGVADGDAHIFSFEFNTTSSAMFIGGGVSVASGNVGVQTIDGITIGSVSDGSAPANITVAEFIIFDGLLSVSDHNEIGNALSTTYGLPYTDRV